MPSDCYIKQEKKYLHVHLTGHLTSNDKVKNIIDILNMIDEECELAGLGKALVVWELLDSTPTLIDYQKALNHRHIQTENIKTIAFVYVFPKNYKSEYLGVVLANKKGHNIHTFIDESEAEKWLKDCS